MTVGDGIGLMILAGLILAGICHFCYEAGKRRVNADLRRLYLTRFEGDHFDLEGVSVISKDYGLGYTILSIGDVGVRIQRGYRGDTEYVSWPDLFEKYEVPQSLRDGYKSSLLVKDAQKELGGAHVHA